MRKRLRRAAALALAAVLLAVSTPVLAKQGEVCSSKPVLKDGTLTNDIFLFGKRL